MASVGTATFTAVADFSQVRNEAKKTEASLQGLQTATDGVGDVDPAARMGRDWGKTAKTMKSTGRSMTMGLTLPIALLGGAAVKTFADFETAIANVQANSGATAEEMERVRTAAKNMGRETAFTATDSANAMFQLSAAGYNVDESITAVKSTMLLASAAGVSLEDATDLVTKSMKAFGLNAEDAAHVSDVFTQAANQTSATVEDLHFGMAQAGQLGTRYGQSLETVTAGLSALIDQGVPAASAGVGLRQAFDKLAAPTTRAAGFIDELGMNFRNADGSMKQLPDVIGELEKGFQGLSKAERDQAMQAIFGVEGAKAMSLAMNTQYKASTKTAQGQEAVRKATDVMGQAWVDAHMKNGKLVATGSDAIAMLTAMNQASDGTAQAFDDIKKETPARKMEELKGSIEELMNSMISAVGGPLKGIIEGLTGFVNLLSRFAEAHPAIAALVVGLLAALAVLGPLLVMTAHVIEAFMFLKGLKMFGWFATLAKGIVMVVWELGKMLVSLTVATARLIAQGVAMAAHAIAMGAVRVATMLWTAAQWLLNAALTANPIGVIIMAVVALVAAIVWLWNNNEGFRNFVLAAWEKIKQAFKVVADFVKAVLVPIFKKSFEIIKAVVGGLFKWWKFQWTVAFKVVQWLVKVLVAIWQKTYEWLANIWNGIWNVWKAVWDRFYSIVTGVFRAVQGAISSVVQWIGDRIQGVLDFFGAIGQAIRNLPVISQVMSFLGMSQGGIVPGKGNRDSVPTMLTPGEAVVPKDVVKRLGRRQVQALIDGKGDSFSAPKATSTVTERNDNRTTQVNVYNPKPERASDSLPRTIRKLQWMGVA